MNEIKATYADIELAVQLLERCAAQANDTASDLNANRQALSGKWVGFGAGSFFREVDNDILPSMQRLSDRLTDASILMRQVGVDFLDTETAGAEKIRQLCQENPPLNPSSPWGDVPTPPPTPGPAAPNPSTPWGDIPTPVPPPPPPTSEYPVCGSIDCKNVTLFGKGVSVEKLPKNPTGPIADLVGFNLDLLITALDALELTISVAGFAGQGLAAAIGSLGGPVGALLLTLLERVGVDAFETILSTSTASVVIFNDIIKGRSYIDPVTNELVLGQSTIQNILEQGADLVLPGTPGVDVASNAAGLYSDISGFFNDDSFQVRVDTSTNPPHVYVVHTEEIQDKPLNALVDFVSGQLFSQTP